jgi:hypothetical protein
LRNEFMEVLARERIVDGLVPAIEPDLTVGGRCDYQKDRSPRAARVCCGPGRPGTPRASCASAVRAAHRRIRRCRVLLSVAALCS